MRKTLARALLAAGFFLASSAQAQVPADLQAKVDAAKTVMAEFAKSAVIIAAVKEANAKGGVIAGMTNAKWDGLAENDPQVTAIDNTPASKQMQAFAAKHPEYNKLYLRDDKGSLVAAGVGGKTLLWNIGSRPFFKTVMEGKDWSEKAVKVDPTTQVKGVVFIVPVMDGGKAIGMLQSNHTAQ